MAKVKPTPLDEGLHVTIGSKISAQKRISGSDHDAFNTWLIDSAMRSVWLHPEISEENRNSRLASVVVALNGLAPQNEVEGMLAAQAVAMHHASMEASRRAMLPDQPFEIAQALRKSAAYSSRAFCALVDALDRRRGKTTQQKVTVEHVHVHAGGQAIVGNVEAGATRGGVYTGSEAEPHAPPSRLADNSAVGAVLPALLSTDPERQPVPIARNAERPVQDARRQKHRAKPGGA